jgi:hypothetical protein
MGGMPPGGVCWEKGISLTHPFIPVYKWISHNAIIQGSYLCLFFYLVDFILQHVISTLELLGSAKIEEDSCDELIHAIPTWTYMRRSEEKSIGTCFLCVVNDQPVGNPKRKV